MRSLSGLLLCIFILACSSQEPLIPLDPVVLSSHATTTVVVNFCTEPSYNQRQHLKTIIILDHSTSNQQNALMRSDGSGIPESPLQISPDYGTDPTGFLRYGDVNTPNSLLNYLSTLSAQPPTNDPDRYFALINFSTNVQSYPTNRRFTSDIADFFRQVQSDSTANNGAPADAGSTNYLAALSRAYEVISNDIALAEACAQLPSSIPPTMDCPQPGVQVASAYAVIFMTDGAPIMQLNVDGNNNLLSVDRQSAVDILTQVNNLVALSSNTRFVTSVNMFTIYYYNPSNQTDNSAINLLSNMARVGRGVAYTAQSGTAIDYTQFQPPRRRIVFDLEDIFVTNESATWWTDGRLYSDRDRDGLPDHVETSWGSNPDQAYSGGNGVNDLVKYVALNGSYSVVNYRGAGQPCSGMAFPYRSSDPSGLNDCEKRILNNTAGINNPDSNGDLIPDWLQFKNWVPFQVGTSSSVNTPLQDGYTLYQKIKHSLPTQISSRQLINLQPSNYQLDLVSQTPDRECYRLRVTDLPIIGDSNTVRVDILMKSDLLQTGYYYRIGRKSFPAGSNYLEFNDWYDLAEQQANTWQTWQ